MNEIIYKNIVANIIILFTVQPVFGVNTSMIYDVTSDIVIPYFSPETIHQDRTYVVDDKGSVYNVSIKRSPIDLLFFESIYKIEGDAIVWKIPFKSLEKNTTFTLVVANCFGATNMSFIVLSARTRNGIMLKLLTRKFIYCIVIHFTYSYIVYYFLLMM